VTLGRPKHGLLRRRTLLPAGDGQIHVSRAKNGAPSVHPLSGVELRARRRLKRDQEPPSPFVFTSERGAPFTTAGWRKLVAPTLYALLRKSMQAIPGGQ